MDVDILRQVVTVVSFVAFLGVIAYAMHPANTRRFEEAARLPLSDQDDHE